MEPKKQITVVVDIYRGRVWAAAIDNKDVDVKVIAFNTDEQKIWYRPVAVDPDFVESAVEIADIFESREQQRAGEELQKIDPDRELFNSLCKNCRKKKLLKGGDNHGSTS